MRGPLDNYNHFGYNIAKYNQIGYIQMSIQIRELRDRTGLSQSAFSKQYGIPLSTLRKWEQGEAEPADYLVKLLAQQIPSKNDRLETIISRDGTVFYFDKAAQTVSDACGNKIAVHDNLEGVKRQNLPLYIMDLFSAYYDAVEKFSSDCRYDRVEDFIWS